VRKTALALVFLVVSFWSCATYQTSQPVLYIDELPASSISELSLDERIQVEEAWELLREGNTKKAQRLLMDLGTSSPFYYAGLGYSLYLQGNHQSAREYFLASVQYYPTLMLGHLGLAQLYQESGQEELAFVEFREILKNEPMHPWVKPRFEALKTRILQNLEREARKFYNRDNIDKAKETYLKALYYSPNSVEAHTALAMIFRIEQSYQNALVHLKAVYDQQPENNEIQKLYADTLYLAEKYKESLEIFEKVQSVEPENKEIKGRIEIIKNRLGIFELPSQFDAIPSSEAVSKEEVAALIGVKFKEILDGQVQNPPIIIDIATSWASKYILMVTAGGIMDVYPNHTFQPTRIITRAEMAEILLRLVDNLTLYGYSLIQHIPPDSVEISDVSYDNYYYQPILKIISYDIMGLTSERTFNPDRAVSGQEAIQFLDIIQALIR
jgi:tetratricopeptide (TPR) repeat protein